MDLLIQPHSVGKGKGVSSHLTFRTYSMPLAGEHQFKGLFYIGRNAAHLTRLSSIFDDVHSADKLDQARIELIRIVEKELKEIPGVIVCEAKSGLEAIAKFIHFLRSHPVLNSIPFVLEGSGLSEKQLAFCRKNMRPDEILELDTCNEPDLNQKFQFLRKVKAKTAQAADRLMEANRRQQAVPGRGSKRVFDILIASIGLILLSPVFLLIAVAIKLESAGPIFYISKRAGRGYRVFNFYKFRTMFKDADKKIAALKHLNQYTTEGEGPVFFKINNDPRITRVGKFLRNTSLDELPQLLNVLLGDMSLVGNRPLPLYEAATLTTDDYAARFMAPAGMTGLWQIKKRGNKNMSVEERINIDIHYAEKCSFATDFWIIANTPSALLQKENV